MKHAPVRVDDPWEGWDELSEPPEDSTWEPSPADEEYAEAVAEARQELGGNKPDSDQPAWIQERFASLDWEAAYATDFSKVDWLPGRFMERGQQITLVGDGKVGKSLFALDWAFRMVAGRSFLGDPRHPPLRVLYFDRENSLRDITTRAQALGARPADLARLIYKPFPQFSGTLDQSEKAARELVFLAVEVYRVDVVILDTVSRFIGGKENDADTWLQLYQHVHQRLKARGIACVRLDHFGKDSERGSRGSSAKSQDVDAVWELTAGRAEKTGTDVEVLSTVLKLNRTHTRTGLGDDLFPIIRRGERTRGGSWLPGRTRHEIADDGILAEATREIDILVQTLIDSGCPVGGREAVKKWMKTHGMPTPRDQTMSEVVRELKARSV